ncbi:unnamed protein product [Symbiodinium sp. CCMP2592]|nr:unnamed protein product [Symbiodinium sp. CCMP2592]
MSAADAVGLKAGKDYPGVGVGAFVFDDRGRVLLVKRSSTSRVAPGTWARPGGAVEHGESCEAALIRELREETGLDIVEPQLLDVSSQISSSSHWVSIGYIAQLAPGCAAESAVNREPAKHDELGFFDLEDLPTPLADFTAPALESLRAKRRHPAAAAATTLGPQVLDEPSPAILRIAGALVRLWHSRPDLDFVVKLEDAVTLPLVPFFDKVVEHADESLLSGPRWAGSLRIFQCLCAVALLTRLAKPAPSLRPPSGFARR